jgi:hypothetical protein
MGVGGLAVDQQQRRGLHAAPEPCIQNRLGESNSSRRDDCVAIYRDTTSSPTDPHTSLMMGFTTPKEYSLRPLLYHSWLGILLELDLSPCMDKFLDAAEWGGGWRLGAARKSAAVAAKRVGLQPHARCNGHEAVRENLLTMQLAAPANPWPETQMRRSSAARLPTGRQAQHCFQAGKGT